MYSQRLANSPLSDAGVRGGVKDIVDRFAALRFPDEAPYVSVVFDEVFEHWSRMPPQRRSSWRRLWRMALPFAHRQTVKLSTSFAIFATWSVLSEINVTASVPTTAQIVEAIRGAAKALGANPQLADQMATDLGPELARLLANLDTNRPALDRVCIEWLIEGRRHRAPDETIDDAKKRIGKAAGFDVIVDELEGMIDSGRKLFKKEAIAGIPLSTRGFLWLVLVNTDGYLQHGTIQEFFRIPAKKSQRSKDQSTYQYRTRLAELVGEPLRDRMVGKGRGRRYEISPVHWSFLWVRRHPDQKRSMLLYDGVSPPDEYQ